MNNYIWIKTLLSTYTHLPKICGAIDKLVSAYALNSVYVNSINIAKNNAEAVTEKILNLSERKVTLINLKISILNALKEMDKQLAKIISLKHFYLLKSEKIAELLNISKRTYFRKLNEAYSKFELEMKKSGNSKLSLFEKLKNEEWIIESYKQNCQNAIKNADNIIVFNPEQIARVCESLKRQAYAR